MRAVPANIRIGNRIDPRRAELSGLTSGETLLRLSFLSLSHDFSWILIVSPPGGGERPWPQD